MNIKLQSLLGKLTLSVNTVDEWFPEGLKPHTEAFDEHLARLADVEEEAERLVAALVDDTGAIDQAKINQLKHVCLAIVDAIDDVEREAQ